MMGAESKNPANCFPAMLSQGVFWRGLSSEPYFAAPVLAAVLMPFRQNSLTRRADDLAASKM